MSQCRPAQRSAVTRARGALAPYGCVLALTILEPADTPTGSWELAMLLDVDGVPPAVLSALAGYGLSVRHAHAAEGCWRAVAVA